MKKTDRTINTAAHYFSPRLMGALAAVFKRPLAFIHAPMGHGKTTTVREYLRRTNARAVWTLVLTHNPEVFWREFCRALRGALSKERKIRYGAGAREARYTLGALEALGYPSDSVKIDAAREMLSRLHFAKDTVLVFDDVHLLPEGEGGGLVRLCPLLARQTSGDEPFPRMVLISRHEPGKALAEPMLKGFVAAAGPDLFILTAGEIQSYYEACGLRLADDAAASLRKTTGGWISALYLYLLHYSQHGELVSPTALHSLLANEIFDPLPEGAQLLLLSLSPLDRFTVEQARFVHDGAEAFLADITRRNAFIGYDAATKSYALHGLFRAFLTTLFKKLPLDEQQAIHQRNAAWFIKQGDVTEALKFLHQAGDFAHGLAVVGKAATRMQVTEANGLLLNFFRNCPPDLLDTHPGATFRYAMAALSARDYPVFGAQLARLEGYCNSLPKAAPAANRWRGELELLRSFTKYNDITAMSVHHRRAGEFFAKARQPVQGRIVERRTRSRFFGLEPWTLGSPSVLYMFHRQSGALDKELAAMRECLPHYSRLTGMHGAGAEDVMLAEAHLNAGEFDAAAVACHRAMATALEQRQLGLELCALFVFARLSLLRGGYNQVMELLHAMRQRVEDAKAFALLPTVDLCKGFIYALLGRSEEIPDWLRQSSDSGGDKRLYAFAGGCSYFVHGRILLLAGEYAALAGRFSQLLQSGAFEKNALFTLYAQTYLAAAHSALDMEDEADTALRAALDLALPDKLYLPLAENADFLPQLKRMGEEQAHCAGIKHIFDLSAVLEKARRDIAAHHFTTAPPALSQRERELIRLAQTGMPYKEIGAASGLAPSSVKRYFAALYKKLGVSSREQLAARFGDK